MAANDQELSLIADRQCQDGTESCAACRDLDKNSAGWGSKQLAVRILLGVSVIAIAIAVVGICIASADRRSQTTSLLPELSRQFQKDASLLPSLAVVPYGVLGTQLQLSHTIAPVGTEPASGTAVIDPAGMRFIQDVGPAMAGGASGAIYSWVGIGTDAGFSEDVRTTIRRTGDAKLHDYGGKLVIHTVGPDLNEIEGNSLEARQAAAEELAQAYANILTEFLSSDATGLRLLPVSGGIYAGQFVDEIPQMTFEALDRAFRSLPDLAQQHLMERLRVHQAKLCIFEESKFEDFKSACTTCSSS